METEQAPAISENAASLNWADTPELFAEVAASHSGKLRILAKGDSWFAYPRPWIGWGSNSNILHWLRVKKDLLIHGHSTNGDEALAMASGDSKLALLRTLHSADYDVLLFSGGGNDIVGRYDFDFVLRERTYAPNVEDCLIHDRLQRRLQSVMNAYCDLYEYMIEYSKQRDTVLVTHTYDLAIPDPRGAAFAAGLLEIDNCESWMWPYLMRKGFTKTPEQRQIVALILSQFEQALTSLATQLGPRFVVVRTQGTILDGEWLNEIHPNPTGFQRIAEKIYRDALLSLKIERYGA